MRPHRPLAAAVLAAALLLVGVALSDTVSLTPVGVPKTNKSDPISLPDDREVGSKTRVVTIQATTRDDKAEVQWIVFNANDENPVESLASGKTLLVFPNDQDDVIVVMAYTAADGKPTPAVRTVIKVVVRKPDDKNKPKPAPPKPEPKPEPVPDTNAVKHVTFVLDFSQQTKQIAEVVTDANLRKYLTDAGVKTHVVSTKSKAVTEDGLSVGLKQAGGAPAVVLQDAAGNILAAAKLADSAAVKALVEKYRKEEE